MYPPALLKTKNTPHGTQISQEPLELTAMTAAEVFLYRQSLGVRISGFDPPKPVQSFAQCGFDKGLLAVIAKAGFEHPTAIQAQALPAALSGRDVLVRRVCLSVHPC